MRTGRCLCGSVTFELAGDLIATAVCHCDHCQRQSGGAFSVNLVAHESQLTLHGELKTYEERGDNNDDVYVRRRFCGSCGSPIVSELSKSDGVIAVKVGVLDDKSTVVPTVEVWCVDRQPWVSLPGMAVSPRTRVGHARAALAVRCRRLTATRAGSWRGAPGRRW